MADWAWSINEALPRKNPVLFRNTLRPDSCDKDFLFQNIRTCKHREKLQSDST